MKSGQLFYRSDFACPSSPCIFGPRKEGGGDAETAKNRGVPAHSPKAGIRLSAGLPAGLLRDLEEGSRPSLLPTASGSAFVCLEALRGQEEAAGPGNNGSFSGSLRLPRSDRGRGTMARMQAQPPSAAAAGDDVGGPSPAHSSSPDPKPGSSAQGGERRAMQKVMGACLQPAQLRGCSLSLNL